MRNLNVSTDEMTEGYSDGLKAYEVDFPDRLSNRGAAYRHGWLNGRDDRIRSPRKAADELRDDAKSAEEADKSP